VVLVRRIYLEPCVFRAMNDADWQELVGLMGRVVSSSFHQEEDEVPDDETLNQMIARSEDEFEHFMVKKTPYVLRYFRRNVRVFLIFLLDTYFTTVT